MFDPKKGIKFYLNNIPSRGVIVRINNILNQTGCVNHDLLKSKVRSKTVGIEDNIQKVLKERCNPDSSKSHRRIAKRLGLSNSSVYQMINDDPSLPDKIGWSDEAKFHTNGSVNRHNSRLLV